MDRKASDLIRKVSKPELFVWEGEDKTLSEPLIYLIK